MKKFLFLLIAMAVSLMAEDPVKLEFFGHSHFRLTSPKGVVILINPWITANPVTKIPARDNPSNETTVAEAIAGNPDIILVADAHQDEQGNTIDIAKATKAIVIAPSELRGWFLRQGIPEQQAPPFIGPGSSITIKGIKIRTLNSLHGSGLASSEGPPGYGGIAASFMVTFENGLTLYFAGSSGATLDMQMWGEMYQPHVAIVHQSRDHDPEDSAMVVKLLGTKNPNLRTVIPHHHAKKPSATEFTPADLQKQIEKLGAKVQFLNPEPKKVYLLLSK